MARTNLTVKGMTCGHCTHAVKTALEGLDGVRSARVDLEGGTAVVDYDDGVTEPREMGIAVADAGYEAMPAEQ
jgi:copper chaperone